MFDLFFTFISYNADVSGISSWELYELWESLNWDVAITFKKNVVLS